MLSKCFRSYRGCNRYELFYCLHVSHFLLILPDKAVIGSGSSPRRTADTICFPAIGLRGLFCVLPFLDQATGFRKLNHAEPLPASCRFAGIFLIVALAIIPCNAIRIWAREASLRLLAITPHHTSPLAASVHTAISTPRRTPPANDAHRNRNQIHGKKIGVWCLSHHLISLLML